MSSHLIETDGLDGSTPLTMTVSLSEVEGISSMKTTTSTWTPAWSGYSLSWVKNS